MFPPIPLWEGSHPIIVHLPVALLLVAPLFVVLSLALPRHSFGIALSGWILMLLGTAGAFAAVRSGEAAAGIAERNEAINVTLEQHEELAETTQWVFAVLTALYAGVLFAPMPLKKPAPSALRVVANVVFLLLYVGGASLLSRTAHLGGVLVHHHGVQALVEFDPASPAAENGRQHDD